MFTFTIEQIRAALLANGWKPLWTETNWVHESASNPDTAGVSMIDAFQILLRSKNLI